MKKFLLSVACVALAAAVGCLSAFSPNAAADTTVLKAEVSTPAAITVSNPEISAPDQTQVLNSRFLNMLNHSFVYDTDFDSVEDIVNSSMPALLDLRDSEDDSYISQALVSDYVFNMYGIVIDDYSGINSAFPQREGYVFILPRGYSVYTHEIVSAVQNEDGSYTVETNVTVSTHDSASLTQKCETLFVPNADSQFGFNIIYSDIISGTAAL